MANLAFNIAKGRLVELARNVDAGSPANSRLILIPFNNDGSSTDDNVRDADTVAAVEALTGVTERTANGWNRKTLAAADVTVTVDDSGNVQNVDIPDQTWTPTADAVTDLLLAYDADNTAGTDSDLVPLTWHDFSTTGDGSQVNAVINATGIFQSA
jgi:hypothetical protein